MLLSSAAMAENDCKVDICHFPPGNPANVRVISVSVEALDAHLAHGDSMGFRGDCYVFIPVRKQLLEAEQACRDDFGGHFASIHSDEENDDVSHLIDPLAMGDIVGLIGAYEPAGFCAGPAADSTWTDGTPWDYDAWRSGTSEPNCSPMGPASVQFHPHAKLPDWHRGWNDVRADRLNTSGYVCKFGGP